MTFGEHRHLYEIPDGIAYFNTAYNGPMLRASRIALEAAAGAKTRPWERRPANFFDQPDRLRSLAAGLFGATADHYAIVPSASYGISTAARIMEPRLGPGDRILLLDQQFPSNVTPWRRVAAESGASIATVPTPANGDWTSAVLAMLDSSVKVASLPACHWTNGARIDLDRIGPACRANGTVLVLDTTQSLSAVPLDLATVQPDFMVAAGYKWMLAPYGFGLFYVDERWHDARPLEEGWLSRANAEDFARLVEYCDDYRVGARRFDVGETCVPTVHPGAIAALEQLGDWGISTIAETLGRITQLIADEVTPLGFEMIAPDYRSPHLLGIDCPIPPGELVPRLAERNVFVSQRGQSVRIAPHLHITDADIDVLLTTIRETIG